MKHKIGQPIDLYKLNNTNFYANEVTGLHNFVAIG